MNLNSVLERAATRSPFWAELWEAGRPAAARLDAMGARDRACVVLTEADSPELYASVLACWQAGVLPAVVDPSLAALGEELGGLTVAAADLAGAGARGPVVEHRDDTPVLLSFTSGTTGKPKGAVLGSGPVALATSCIADRLSLRADDVVVCAVPMASSFQLVAALIPAAHAGCRFVSGAGLNAPDLWALMQREQATVLVAYGPTLSDVLASAPSGRPASLRVAMSGGAPLAPRLKRDYRSRLGVPLIESYGQSELGGFVAMGDPRDNDPRAFSHTGRPLPDRPAWVDDDAGGEIVLSGRAMVGYLGMPEATAAVLAPPGLRTGDIGTCDADGYIRVLGRRGGLLPDGRWPRAVDDELYEEPAVHHAAAVARGDEVVAFVQPAAGETVDEAGIADRHGLATVRAVTTMPRTFSGKIDRQALPET